MLRMVLWLAFAGVIPAAALAASEPDVPEAAEACLSCHAIRPGEPELEGPTLWGVVGRRIAGAPDYLYSEALRSRQGTWDRATLDRFLAAPQAFAPGLNMTFGGVRRAADRRILLDFLETLTPAGVLAEAGAAEPSDRVPGPADEPGGGP